MWVVGRKEVSTPRMDATGKASTHILSAAKKNGLVQKAIKGPEGKRFIWEASLREPADPAGQPAEQDPVASERHGTPVHLPQ